MPDDFLPIEHPNHGETQVPVPDGSDKYHAGSEQLMLQLSQSAVIAQNNFITVSKAQDYDYLEGKRVITLEEAVGVREVSSKSVPAGPTSNN